MIFDTHAHYDDEAFDEDRPELLGRLQEAGVGAVMNVAASLESCRSTLKLAEAYDWIYGAMGVHPSETGELDVYKRQSPGFSPRPRYFPDLSVHPYFWGFLQGLREDCLLWGS